MGSLTGVKTIKGRGGLNRGTPSTDAIFGLITTGVLPTGISSFGNVVKLAQKEDAELLGLDESFDANNDVLIYHHISEFFRLQPNGTLYLTILDQSETATTITDGASGISKLEKFIKSEVANREIKYIGLALNRQAEYTPTYTAGLDDDIHSAIVKAQAVFTKLLTENVIVDGLAIGAIIETDVTVTNLQDIRTLASENITVVIAQDPKTKEMHSANCANVGTVLGALAVRMVQESLGSIDIRKKPDKRLGEENYTLTDNAQELWLSANLSDGRSINDSLTDTDIQNLTDKGYVFAASYEGYAGIYFNDSPTCTEISDDYAYIEANRTWGKAARIVIKTLTPKIKSDVDIDKTTGYIDSTIIDDWTQTVLTKVGQMLKDEEVSGIDFYIDPAQDVFSGNPIATQLTITPKSIARTISATIGFVNPFKL